MILNRRYNMIDEETNFIIGISLLIVGIMIVAIICFAVVPVYMTCHSKAEKQGLECDWGPLQGCMVKLPSGKWMDYDRLRYME